MKSNSIIVTFANPCNTLQQIWSNRKKGVNTVLLAAFLTVVPATSTGFLLPNYVAAAEQSAVEQPFDYLVLVNKENRLPQNYESQVELIDVENSFGAKYRIEKETYDHFVKLREAVLKKGIQIELDSVYRSVARQQEIVDEFTKTSGADYVKKYVAVPGYSEHHTGLAVDICLVEYGKIIDDNDAMIERKETFKEIHGELANFGFILRYLPGKDNITGYSYEPWHFRYVGEKAAKEITQQGLTLEEFIAKRHSPTK